LLFQGCLGGRSGAIWPRPPWLNGRCRARSGLLVAADRAAKTFETGSLARARRKLLPAHPRRTAKHNRMTACGALSGRSIPRASASDFAPNVWTGCPSQVRGCCRKSLICIRPVDRRAGRGLDGNTHAPLISLADRLSSSHSGHQIQGASIDPFHAAPQSRELGRDGG
jgi:hypothetical protein